MKYIKRFILMVQFLTRIPIKKNIECDNEEFGKALAFAPLVGFIIGIILWSLNKAMLDIFPQIVRIVLLVVGYIIITGGLHLDGLGDTFDGLFSNRTKERILEIMRDSRVGTNAVLAVVCLLLLNIFLLSGLPSNYFEISLLMFPVAGRIASIVGAAISIYARSGEGLGKSFVDYCGYKEVLTGIFFEMLIFFCILGVKGLIISTIPPMSAVLLTKYFSRKIGGVTGDILGAVLEINQVVFLMSFYFLFVKEADLWLNLF